MGRQHFLCHGQAIASQHRFRLALGDFLAAGFEQLCRGSLVNGRRTHRRQRTGLARRHVLTKIVGRTDRARTGRGVAIHRHTLADQVTRAVVRIVGAAAQPQHGGVFAALIHDLDRLQQIGLGRRRHDGDHHVHPRVSGNGHQRRAVKLLVAGGCRSEIGRITDLAITRHQFGKCRLRVRGKSVPLQVEHRAGIGQVDHIATGWRHCGQPAPFGPFAFAQEHRGFVQLVTFVDADQTILPAHRVDDVVVACDCASVRRRRAAADFGGAKFQDDQRLFQLRGFFRQCAEFVAALDALDRQQHHVGRFRMQHEAREIQRVDVGFVTATRFIADAQAMVHRAPHDSDLPQAAAVAHHRDIARRARLSFHRRGRRHRKAVDKIHDAIAVGAHETNAELLAELDQAFLLVAAFRRTGFVKAAAEHGGELHAFFTAFCEHIKYAVGGHHDTHMIGHFRQIANVGITLHPAYIGKPRVDWVHIALVAKAHHLLIDAAAKGREVIGRTDERHRAGRHQRRDVIGVTGQCHCLVSPLSS